MARPRKGSLLWRRAGWSARYYDAAGVRRCVPLGTDNRSLAQARLKDLLAGAEPEAAAAPETFEAAARRIVPEQGIATEVERLRRLEVYAYPSLGPMPVTTIRAAHVRAVLESAAAKGLSRTTVSHLKDDISGVLQQLWKDETLKENPAKRVDVPRSAAVDGRPRAVLTDDEFNRLVAWPDLDAELRTLIYVSRTLGGMRTSDLRAWDWSHVDTATWLDAYVPRPKTRTRDRLALPAMLVPVLRAWWTIGGEPKAGPVFTQRGGASAGERRGKGSFAGRLRKALWSAGVRRGDTKDGCELQTDTAETRRVDFHSFRRAFATGLASAGVNVQLAMRLAGHRSTQTHARYVLVAESVAVPDAALPRAPAVPIQTPPDLLSHENDWRPQRDLNPCYRRERPPGRSDTVSLAQLFRGASDRAVPGETPNGHAPVPDFRRAADAALSAYLRTAADELAAGLSPDRPARGLS